MRAVTSTTCAGASSRNTPTVITSRGRRFTMSRTWSTVTWRRLGANTNPSASAPSATASSASSSLVIPQILTNTRRYRPSRIDQAIVVVVVVGLEVEEAVTGVVEEDYSLLARRLRGQRFVDHAADGVAGLGCGDLALGPGELHRGLERLALRVRDRLHAA